MQRIGNNSRRYPDALRRGGSLKHKNRKLVNQDNYTQLHNDKFLTIMNTGQVYVNDDEYLKRFIKESAEFIKLIIIKLKKHCSIPLA